MDYEVYPRVGLGPFRLGMTQEEAEKLRNRLGLPKPPDSFYLEYEEGCLSRIGLNTSENIRILYRGQDLIHTHVEDVIAVLSKESGFVCDCVDHDLADTYNFPVLGLELWREEPYHPKLLKEPGFQRMITRDPFTDYQRGWYFLQVWVQSDQFRADFPLRECPAPDYDSWFLRQEEPAPIPPERLAAVAKNTDWSRRGGPAGERTHDRHQIHESDRDGRLFQGAGGAGVPSQAGVPVASPGRILF